MFQSLLLLTAVFAAAAPARTRPSPSAAPAAATALSPEELFSQRALRRARLLIQMRMLQLRGERLECVREVLLRRLPPELRPERPPARTAPQRTRPGARVSDCAR